MASEVVVRTDIVNAGQRCPVKGNAMTDTYSLYDPSFEHDACGVGMVADLTANPTNGTVTDALTILENLEHRGATGADVDSGDGAGILLQMPDSFVREVFGPTVPTKGSYGIAHWMIPTDLDVPVVQATIETGFDTLALSITTAILVSGFTPDDQNLATVANERMQRAIHTARNIVGDAKTSAYAKTCG